MYDPLRYAELSKFSDQIYLGGHADIVPEARDQLRALGITHIVNLTGGDVLYDIPGIEILHIEQDDRTRIPPSNMREFLAWMEALPPDAVVLIHCAAGISRTPSYLIAWLMHRAGDYTPDRLGFAWHRHEREVRRVRPIIDPHPFLRESVIDYFKSNPPPGA